MPIIATYASGDGIGFINKVHYLAVKDYKEFTREEFFEQFPGAKTFPQIIVDGKKIGGYTELAIQLGKTPNNTGDWIGVGTAIGAAVFAATNEPVWIAVGVAVGAALGWQKPED